ncbi:MAG TPA: DUF3800 domain-containing protein [Fimbriimonas sp.]|nr:DUF3800 domain-containing protein [Fimbriimonas sp.]
MKFAFLDESGKAPDPISVVAGVVIDSYRVHATTRQWNSMIIDLSTLAGTSIKEFHMRNAYGGRHEWSRCGIANRSKAINQILDWLATKDHSVVFSATQKSKFTSKVAAGCPMVTKLGSRWVSECFHVALSINKEFKGKPKNKGKTTLIFDEGAGYEKVLSDLLVSPPAWSDTYYGRGRKEIALSEIFATSLFADSQHAPLIQLADTAAFILRRYAEIRDAGQPERFKGELANLTTWIGKIQPEFQSSSHRYKKTSRCVCADLFYQIAPDSLRVL